MTVVFILVIMLTTVIPAVAIGFPPAGASSQQRARRWVSGFNLINGIIFLMVIGIVVVSLLMPSAARAAGPSQQQQTVGDPYASLAAALASGLACIGAGIAVSSTGSAAIGTIAERPDAFGRALIFVGLAEGIAIYGLIIAFMILSR